MPKRTPKLPDLGRVVIAWAESCAGPGWANSPVWYIWRDSDGVLRQDCLQPDEQTDAMLSIFPYSRLAAAEMTRAVAAHVERRSGRANR